MLKQIFFISNLLLFFTGFESNAEIVINGKSKQQWCRNNPSQCSTVGNGETFNMPGFKQTFNTKPEIVTHGSENTERSCSDMWDDYQEALANWEEIQEDPSAGRNKLLNAKKRLTEYSNEYYENGCGDPTESSSDEENQNQ